MKKILSLITTVVLASAFIVVLAGCGSQPTKSESSQPKPVDLDGKTYITETATVNGENVSAADLDKDAAEAFFTIVVKSHDDVRILTLGVPYLASYEGEGNSVEFTITDAPDGQVFKKGQVIKGELDGGKLLIKLSDQTSFVLKTTNPASSK